MTLIPSPSNLLTPQNTQDPDTTDLMATDTARDLLTTSREATAMAADLPTDPGPATTLDLPLTDPDLATPTSSPHTVMASPHTAPKVTASLRTVLTTANPPTTLTIPTAMLASTEQLSHHFS